MSDVFELENEIGLESDEVIMEKMKTSKKSLKHLCL